MSFLPLFFPLSIRYPGWNPRFLLAIFVLLIFFFNHARSMTTKGDSAFPLFHSCCSLLQWKIFVFEHVSAQTTRKLFSAPTPQTVEVFMGTYSIVLIYRAPKWAGNRSKNPWNSFNFQKTFATSSIGRIDLLRVGFIVTSANIRWIRFNVLDGFIHGFLFCETLIVWPPPLATFH